MTATENSTITLTTGRKFYAYQRIIGIGPSGEVYEGYDGYVYEASNNTPPTNWPHADRTALAQLMIARWTAYLEEASKS